MEFAILQEESKKGRDNSLVIKPMTLLIGIVGMIFGFLVSLITVVAIFCVSGHENHQKPGATTTTMTECSESGTSKTVAFTAYMSADHAVSLSRSLTKGMTFVFDKTETNIGESYNISTGVFRAPFNGTYGFTWTICVDAKNKESGHFGEFGVELIIGGRVCGALHVDTETNWDDACSTAFMIKEVLEGNDVFLRNHFVVTQGRILSAINQTLTTFSGWKIY